MILTLITSSSYEEVLQQGSYGEPLVDNDLVTNNLPYEEGLLQWNTLIKRNGHDMLKLMSNDLVSYGYGPCFVILCAKPTYDDHMQF